jgi:hypothetical protein
MSWFVLVFPGSGSVPTGFFLQIVISCSSGSSLAYVLCNVYIRNVQPVICSTSGSGCKLEHIHHLLSIYLVVRVQCCGWC